MSRQRREGQPGLIQPIEAKKQHGYSRKKAIVTAEDENGWPDFMSSLAQDIGRRPCRPVVEPFQEPIKLYITDEENLIKQGRRVIEELNIHEPGLARHTREVVKEAFLFAVWLGIEDRFLEEGVDIAAMKHDYGKLWIDNKILKKKKALNSDELQRIRLHAEFSRIMAAMDPETSDIGPIVGSVHEHWDGGGYPQGLKGQEIPFWSRFLAIIDSWDALTHDREYRQALKDGRALWILAQSAYEPEEMLMENGGSKGLIMDLELVKLFIEYHQSGRNTLLSYWEHRKFDGTRPAKIAKKKTISETYNERGIAVELMEPGYFIAAGDRWEARVQK